MASNNTVYRPSVMDGLDHLSRYGSGFHSSFDSPSRQQQQHQQQSWQQWGQQYEDTNYGKTIVCPTADASQLYEPTTSNIKSKRTVRFSPMLEVYSDPTDLNDIVSGCWYSRDELQQFKGERKMIIRMLKFVNFDISQIDTSVYDLRGLEAYSSMAFNAFMQKKRKAVYQAVIQEQYRQRRMGKQDAGALRIVAATSSQWARERGLQLGRDDARLVGTSPFDVSIMKEPMDMNIGTDAMDEGHDQTSVPLLRLLSRDSFSTASGSESDSSWAEKLMGEALLEY